MSWWNYNWLYRQQLLSIPSGNAYTSGVHYLHLDLDLQSLASFGMVRTDYADIRIIYSSGIEEHNIPYFIASGRSPARIYFPSQNDIPQLIDIGNHGSGWNYHVYYGNKNGHIQELPQNYININFPQAPYSPTTEWYWPTGAVSGFKDKCLYRLNDDPAVGNPSGFEDATGFTTGVAIFGGTPHPQSGVYKGKSGRLDLATEFDRSNRGSIKVLDNFDGRTGASGNWCIDFWVYPYNTAGTQYWFVKKRNDNDNTKWVTSSRYIYSATYDSFSEYTLVRKTDSQTAYNSWAAATNEGIPANEWSHVRLYYGKKAYTDWSCIFMYVDGNAKGTVGSCGWPPSEPYLTQMHNGDCVIGGALDSTTYEFDGKIEQFRYSTRPWFADLSYDDQNPNSRLAPPDWINNEYDITLGTLEVDGRYASGTFGGILKSDIGYIDTSGFIGGYGYGRYQQTQDMFGGFLESTAFLQSGILGGYLYSNTIEPPHSGSMGGYLESFTTVNFESIGGWLNALPLQSGIATVGGVAFILAGISEEQIGGFAIATWNVPGNSIIDGLMRALIKGRDYQVVRQQWGADSQLYIYANYNNDFDSKLSINNLDNKDIDALLNIIKVKKNPYIKIINVNINGQNPWVVTIEASGYAYNNNNTPIMSGIHYANFIWTDGDITQLTNITASGAVFNSTHTYTHSGLFKPIVMGYDKLGTAGSDYTEINLASGQYPYISLTGIPRAGLVPPVLTVDFTAQTSGILGSHTIFWSYANGLTQYNNALNTITQYVMPGDYMPYVRLVDERGIPVVDTLKIGYNK